MSSHLHPIVSFSASLICWVFDRLFGFKFDYSFFWVFECTLSFSSLPLSVPCVYLGNAYHSSFYGPQASHPPPPSLAQPPNPPLSSSWLIQHAFNSISPPPALLSNPLTACPDSSPDQVPPQHTCKSPL